MPRSTWMYKSGPGEMDAADPCAAPFGRLRCPNLLLQICRTLSLNFSEAEKEKRGLMAPFILLARPERFELPTELVGTRCQWPRHLNKNRFRS